MPRGVLHRREAHKSMRVSGSMALGDVCGEGAHEIGKNTPEARKAASPLKFLECELLEPHRAKTLESTPSEDSIHTLVVWPVLCLKPFVDKLP